MCLLPPFNRPSRSICLKAYFYLGVPAHEAVGCQSKAERYLAPSIWWLLGMQVRLKCWRWVGAVQVGPIYDDELAKQLVRPLPEGARLHCLVDACKGVFALGLPSRTYTRADGWSAWEAGPFHLARPDLGPEAELAVQCCSGQESQWQLQAMQAPCEMRNFQQHFCNMCLLCRRTSMGRMAPICTPARVARPSCLAAA